MDVETFRKMTVAGKYYHLKSIELIVKYFPTLSGTVIISEDVETIFNENDWLYVTTCRLWSTNLFVKVTDIISCCFANREYVIVLDRLKSLLGVEKCQFNIVAYVKCHINGIYLRHVIGKEKFLNFLCDLEKISTIRRRRGFNIYCMYMNLLITGVNIPFGYLSMLMNGLNISESKLRSLIIERMKMVITKYTDVIIDVTSVDEPLDLSKYEDLPNYSKMLGLIDRYRYIYEKLKDCKSVESVVNLPGAETDGDMVGVCDLSRLDDVMEHCDVGIDRI